MATTIITKFGSGAPAASDVVRGELAVDTENKRLYTENSVGSVVELGTNPAANITFGDNIKAIFGAGSDLQIYHDGSNSYVDDTGTGNLIIRASAAAYINAAGTNATMGAFVKGGGAFLYHNGNQKFTTTSTGIDVTGTVSADKVGITEGELEGNSGNLQLQSLSTGIIYDAANGYHTFRRNGTNVVQINGATGDISFYEDTGTTAKLFWDASAESLGIGETGPFDKLVVRTTDVNSVQSALSLKNGDIGTSAGVALNFVVDDANDVITSAIYGQRTASAYHQGSLQFLTRDSGGAGLIERMRIDSSGRVGIGTTSPSEQLHVYSTGTAKVEIEGGANGDGELLLTETGSSGFSLKYDGGDNKLLIGGGTAGTFTTRMSVDRDSGNVGIGTSSASATLALDKNTGSQHRALDLENNSITYSMYVDQDNSSTNSWSLFDTTNSQTALRYLPSSSGYWQFYTNDSERMRIDSSGALGLGTTPPSTNIHPQMFIGTESVILGSTGGALNIGNNLYYNSGWKYRTTGAGSLQDFDASGNIVFYRAASGTANAAVTLNKSMQIDSSGNLLVGTDSTSVGSSTTEEGFTYINGQDVQVARENGTVAVFNRWGTSADGTIVSFKAAGSAVGNIGTNSGNIYLTDGARSLIVDGSVVKAGYSTGGDADNAQDLGSSSVRWRDLYLSSGVYLGGTAAANHLDDYEEGTWTPTLPNGGTLTVQSATYTKIGRQVNVRGYIQNISPTANTSQFAIGGLPFTTSNDGYGAGSISYSASFDVSGLGLLNSISNSYLYFHYIDGSSAASLSNNNWISTVHATSGQLIFQITYYT